LEYVPAERKMTNSLTKTVGDITNIEDISKTDEYLTIVNHQPPKDHVHNHPIADGVKYIPIGIIETMLTKVFRHWNVEILREGQLLNSIYVTVRVNYLHPITKEWEHQDGVGAVAIQVDKGKNASELGAIKSNAIMLALPSAKSFAIKDAAEHIGRAFGRDMNRKDTLAFNTYTDTGLTPMNTLITVPQIKELSKLSMEYSGLNEEDAAQWFYEIIGIQYSQVKKIEFEPVKQKLEDERNV
jgi:hypothetical protein